VVHGWRDVEDARPDVEALGAGSDPRQQHLVGRDVGVLIEEVVLGRPPALQLVLVGQDSQFGLAQEATMLGLAHRDPRDPWV
jgi:hypothetical protein